MRCRRRERDVLPHRRLRRVERAPPLLPRDVVAATQRLGEAGDRDARGACAIERRGELRRLELRELDVRRDAASDLPVAVTENPIERELLAFVDAAEDLRGPAAPS